MNNLVMCVGAFLAVYTGVALVIGLPASESALWILFLVGVSMAAGGFLSKETS